MKALSDLKGYRKDEQRFQIRIGRNEMVKDRVSDDRAFSTPTFAVDEIIEVYASAPQSKEIKVDEVIFGYNGIDDYTAITARKGDRIPIHIKLSGRLFELRAILWEKSILMITLYSKIVRDARIFVQNAILVKKLIFCQLS